jgi:hypothetical protein
LFAKPKVRRIMMIQRLPDPPKEFFACGRFLDETADSAVEQPRWKIVIGGGHQQHKHWVMDRRLRISRMLVDGLL